MSTRPYRPPPPPRPKEATALDVARARAACEPVRAHENPERHEYEPPKTDSPLEIREVRVYCFTVYRADGLRAISIMVNAEEAGQFAGAHAWESRREAARRIAKTKGLDHLVRDYLGNGLVDGVEA